MTKQREKLYESYRRLGMTEEQINAIREFDDAVERGDTMRRSGVSVSAGSRQSKCPAAAI